MGWNNIRLDQADVLFSKYIRFKAKKCAYCGRAGTGALGIFGLQASHFHSRRKESVRFDEENVDPLCVSCHRKLGTDNKPEYEAWKIKQLGQKKFDLLMLRANTPQKKDRKLVAIVYRKLLKEMGL